MVGRQKFKLEAFYSKIGTEKYCMILPNSKIVSELDIFDIFGYQRKLFTIYNDWELNIQKNLLFPHLSCVNMVFFI